MILGLIAGAVVYFLADSVWIALVAFYFATAIGKWMRWQMMLTEGQAYELPSAVRTAPFVSALFWIVFVISNRGRM